VVIQQGERPSVRFLVSKVTVAGLVGVAQFFRGRYIQDVARVHTVSSTMQYLCTMATVIEDWPANSPDLNLIENLWATLKRRVEELWPGTKDELIQVLFDVWEALEMDLVSNLVDSMTRRTQLVIRKAGDRISYGVNS
jgi:hypothetical protein